MRAVCVFCGSSPGASPAYAHTAQALGRTLAARKVALVYGGARPALMDAVAAAVLAAGGRVTGVIPRALEEREVAHTGLSELRVVATMHERKAAMAALSDGFVALPGGLGTLEELFEVWTWAQLGMHAKPCAVLDVAGYYQPLLRFLDAGVAAGFVRPAHRAMLLVDDDPDRLLDRMDAYTAPPVRKWVGAAEV